MVLYLGIDGGGSGCRAAIADESGRVLARAEAGPANIASNLPLAVQNLMSVSETVLSAAIGSATSADFARVRAGLGLAGANAKAGVQSLLAQLPYAARIETDAFTTAKGALGDGDGIIAAMGTGSVFLRQRGNQVEQSGGWGFVLGDEGSGAVIGRSLLAAVLRAVDGLCPMTPLLAQVLAEQGGAAQIVQFGFRAHPVDFARLAPRAVGSDDPAAVAIMAEAFTHVAASIRQLQTEPSLPVVFIGGLGAVYARQFSDLWPQQLAAGNSLDGALWLARQGV